MASVNHGALQHLDSCVIWSLRLVPPRQLGTGQPPKAAEIRPRNHIHCHSRDLYPVAAFALSAWAAKLVLTLVWGGAFIGAVLRIRFTQAPKWVVAGPYLVIGWCLLAVIKDAWHQLGVLGFLLFLIGGLLYTLGAIVFAAQRPDPWPSMFGFHEVFHSLTVAAASLHYVAFVFVVLPKAQ